MTENEENILKDWLRGRGFDRDILVILVKDLLARRRKDVVDEGERNGVNIKFIDAPGYINPEHKPHTNKGSDYDIDTRDKTVNNYSEFAARLDEVHHEHPYDGSKPIDHHKTKVIGKAVLVNNIMPLIDNLGKLMDEVIQSDWDEDHKRGYVIQQFNKLKRNINES